MERLDPIPGVIWGVCVAIITELIGEVQALPESANLSSWTSINKMIYEWPETEAIAKPSKFSPGSPLHPANDFFVREVIQPAVTEHISAVEDWAIQIFSYFNVIVLMEVTQLFLWVGTSNLLQVLWPYQNLIVRDVCYTLLGFLFYTISIRFFPQGTVNVSLIHELTFKRFP